jgi:hypothetical protein
VKKHKNIVLYQNIGGHKGSTKFSVRKNRVEGAMLECLINYIMLNGHLVSPYPIQLIRLPGPKICILIVLTVMARLCTN